MNALEEQISRLKTVVEDCYIAVSENNGEVPEEQTLINLPEAIKTTTSGGSSETLERLFGLPENVPSLVIGSDTDIYTALQDIVPTMDLNLSAEVAAEFTRKTQTLCGNDTSIGESREQGNGSELEQFFGVVEPKDCQWMTDQEVCEYLEQIMQSLDPELTAEQASSITTQTQQA